MTVTADDLAEQYRSALQQYLRDAGESALERAYDLGRQALDSGFGIVEMAALQQRTLAEVLAARHPGEEAVNTVKVAQNFFVESLSPFEMTHRGFREANSALRRLNEHLNDKLEEVAKQIALALHDEAWQLLSVVYMDLEMADREVPEAARQRLRNVKGSLKELEQSLRRLSHEIRPKVLDDLGVIPALKFLAEGISKRAGIPITVEGPVGARLPPRVETSVYRIVQEALTNLSRHAGAARASVRVQTDLEKVTCSVRDDGVGFDLREVEARKGYPGLGLLGIQERVASLGGALQINSAPKQGTELLVTIPLGRYRVDSGPARG